MDAYSEKIKNLHCLRILKCKLKVTYLCKEMMENYSFMKVKIALRFLIKIHNQFSETIDQMQEINYLSSYNNDKKNPCPFRM